MSETLQSKQDIKPYWKEVTGKQTAKATKRVSDILREMKI